ncbi:MAG: hypothetical protein ACI4E0_05345 [Blautia sp.]
MEDNKINREMLAEILKYSMPGTIRKKGRSIFVLPEKKIPAI